MKCIIIVSFIAVLFICHIFAKKRKCEERESATEYSQVENGTKDNLITLKIASIGEKIKLSCNYCDQRAKYDSALWKKRAFITNEISDVKIDTHSDDLENRVVLGKTMSLIFRKVTLEDSGYYFCFDREKQTTYPRIEYLLDVQEQSKTKPVSGTKKDFDSFMEKYIFPLNATFYEEKFEVKTPKGSNETLYLDTTKYIVVMDWEEWSECEPCGSKNGQKSREAYCRLYQKINLVKNGRALEIPQPSIGCRSRLLNVVPKLARKLQSIPNFLRIESCEVNCTKGVIAEEITAHKKGIFRKFRKVKEKAKKILKVFKGLKKTTPSPTIKPLGYPLAFDSEFEGSKMKLKCPKVKRKEKVVWYFNYHILDPALTQIQTDGRVKIDKKSFDLIFRPVKASDSGIYTCTVSGVQRANIELNIKKYISSFDVRSPFGAMKCATIASTIVFSVMICLKIRYKRKFLINN
ncbi:hypothetical protein B4U79_17737 [Dinothrombium tinctorium]|uniref:Ig-like domain-containing protein n=1 Tax=Dinothrombium tinctorium TaxID=1965070 RepID=A0A3S4RK42_9ACAR|nr:hypothetical protein B4U79_17748 [Dinothrombium tinctorium]RWS17180.1 hypothetical protein B4U79_17737 [Dinothrombium tinctorium]